MSCDTCHGMNANYCTDVRHIDEELERHGIPVYWTADRIEAYRQGFQDAAEGRPFVGTSVPERPVMLVVWSFHTTQSEQSIAARSREVARIIGPFSHEHEAAQWAADNSVGEDVYSIQEQEHPRGQQPTAASRQVFF